MRDGIFHRDDTAVGSGKWDVGYVPTPEGVVEGMLRMAEVKESDVVYDLGCGDGRIVIAAARDYGARGVGVEIDPQRIEECRINARKAGVGERVQFVEGSLFDVDVSEATVVALYLVPDLNRRLRPRFLRELRGGARIVSHGFAMGDWKPDRRAVVKGHHLFMWVIWDGGMEARRHGGTEARREGGGAGWC